MVFLRVIYFRGRDYDKYQENIWCASFSTPQQGRSDQAKLAEKTNLSVDQISRIERGERAPSLESIEKISNALKIRSSELFNFDDEETTLLSENPSESLELWKLLKSKRPKQVKKITEIAKIVLD